MTQLFTEAGFDISKNTISFNKAGTYIDTYDGATENGSWELTSDEQSIVLDKGTNHEISVRIVRLTDAEFFVDQPVELEDGGTAIIELRYSR
ncbi:MAG: DUF4923 family protein [Hymenobacteraceae bacterium]|nr:DUF4923 family protein [Hymenobacteraceae bacterium]